MGGGSVLVSTQPADNKPNTHGLCVHHLKGGSPLCPAAVGNITAAVLDERQLCTPVGVTPLSCLASSMQNMGDVWGCVQKAKQMWLNNHEDPPVVSFPFTGRFGGLLALSHRARANITYTGENSHFRHFFVAYVSLVSERTPFRLT